jgi:GDP-L-fucose synthase
MNTKSKIYIAGHKGLVGSAIHRLFLKNNYEHIITKDKNQLDLTNRPEVEQFFHYYRPEYVFLAAAKVGGIQYNKNCPADFIKENLLIQSNVIDLAYRCGVKKLCFLGSACIYPKLAEVPIKESSLLSGPLEETNEAYAIAKIAGYYLCKKYTEQYGFNTISVMPTNLYGINDNFRLKESHVIPALINKFLNAKNNNMPSVECFGDGSATREFLYADDLAEAIHFLMLHHNQPDIINVGTGIEISILELTNLIKSIIEYNGNIIWNTSYPNGTPRRVLDISNITSLGWQPKVSLLDGLKTTIKWFLNNQNTSLIRV